MILCNPLVRVYFSSIKMASKHRNMFSRTVSLIATSGTNSKCHDSIAAIAWISISQEVLLISY